MKFVKLLTSAHVNGLLRHPHEGVLHLEDGEADRVIDGGVAEDVSDDFTAKEDKATAAEGVTTDDRHTEASLSSVPVDHQVTPHAGSGEPPAAKADKPAPKATGRAQRGTDTA